MNADAGHDDADEALGVDASLDHAHYFTRQAKCAEAVAFYRQVLEADPGNLLAHYRLAMLIRESRPLAALDLLANACVLALDKPDQLYNYALQCADMGGFAQADVIARHLLALHPDWPAAHFLLARALTGCGTDVAELDALHAFLIRTDPTDMSLRMSRGLLQLRMGNYEAGWDALEWRRAIEPVRSSRLRVAAPRWAGGPLDGRCLLILGEQGHGDILQFARYLPLLLARGAQVVLQLDDNHAGLQRLLSRIDGLDVQIGRDALPDCDLYCPIASLPYVFGTRVDTIPAPPYLSVDPRDVEAWKRRLSRRPRPWVGVCWAGSPGDGDDIRHALPLHVGGRHYAQRQARAERIVAAANRVATATGLHALQAAAGTDAAPAFLTLEALLRRTEGSLIALQAGPHAPEVNELPAALRSRMFSPLDSDADCYDMACLVQALDHVITVDAPAAHLAGALGKPGLLIKPTMPEWRWIGRGGMSLWYPSLRLVEPQEISSD